MILMQPSRVKQIMLQKLRYGVQHEISRAALVEKGNPSSLDVAYVADDMIATLTKEVYGIRKLTTVSKNIKIPATWKDHLRKKMGLKYKTEIIEVKINVDVRALFPEIKDAHETIAYTLNKR